MLFELFLLLLLFSSFFCEKEKQRATSYTACSIGPNLYTRTHIGKTVSNVANERFLLLLLLFDRKRASLFDLD